MLVPHSIGDGTPAGGGTCSATVRNIAPTKPSGVQLASAIVPPGRRHADELGRRALVVGREHRAHHRRRRVERCVGERQLLGVAELRTPTSSRSAAARSAARSSSDRT